ncbi:MAG: hypothetical protein PHY43_02685 [Verrucomicrobiales bacterium]|nr:hypothetical protein [Verrucomicrobiales bacterium]
MKLKYILSCLAAVLLAAPAAFAQTTLAVWTFETAYTSISGTGGWITNIVPEIGSGTASGWHSGLFGTTTYSAPAGNGSAKSFSSNGWTNSPGDFYQFAVSTVSFQDISVSFNQVGSATGPRDFNLQYSTDGISFTTFTSYSLPSSPTSWSSGSSNALSVFSFDLSAITALNNATVVYFRLVDASNASINGGTVAPGGTDRVDNFAVVAAGGTGPTVIITQPQSKDVYFGDTVSFSVLASGEAPVYYQWFYSASGAAGTYSPLADGSSGYGFGTISGSATAGLALSYLNPAQAGYYEVGVSNALVSDYVYSSPAQLTVGIRTPIVTNIAYLRTLQTTNWFPSDTTNLYTVTGTVTTPINMTANTSREFFIQDASTAGIAVFIGGGSYLPDAGDSVQVTGPIGQFNGLLELNLSASNPAHSVNYINSGNPLPAPKFFDFATLTNISLVETNIEGSLAIVSNVFFQLPQVAGFVGNGSLNMTNVNGKVLQLFVNAQASDVIAQTVPTFAASVSGVFGQFTSASPATNAYQLNILQYAGLVSGTMASIPFVIQTAGTNAILTWSGTLFSLQSSTNVAGPYVDISPSTSPYTNYNSNTNSAMFFRLVH